MKKIVNVLFGLILVFLIISVMAESDVWGEEDEENVPAPIVVISSYKVSKDIITPGDNFILTVELENTDKEYAATNILLNLSFSDGISTVYPTLTQKYLDIIEAGEKKTVQFEMYVVPYYSRSTITFGVNIASDGRTNYVNLYAPVKLDMSLFKVVSSTIPEEVNAGDKIPVSLSFRSLLEEKLSNVSLQVFVDDDSKAIATTNIGNISAGASKTQNMAFFIDDAGEHTVKFILLYSTAEGEVSYAELYSGKIKVDGVSAESIPVESETIETPMTDRDKMIIFGCLGGSLLLAIGIVILVKKYN